MSTHDDTERLKLIQDHSFRIWLAVWLSLVAGSLITLIAFSVFGDLGSDPFVYIFFGLMCAAAIVAGAPAAIYYAFVAWNIRSDWGDS